MARITQPLTFYAEVLKALEEIDAPYMIIGAFAAAAYGSERATHDVDMIVMLAETNMDALAARFPSPRYYADPVQMRNATADGTLFNIIDSERGEKVEMIAPYYDEKYVDAKARTVSRDALAFWRSLKREAKARTKKPRKSS